MTCCPVRACLGAQLELCRAAVHLQRGPSALLSAPARACCGSTGAHPRAVLGQCQLVGGPITRDGAISPWVLRIVGVGWEAALSPRGPRSGDGCSTQPGVAAAGVPAVRRPCDSGGQWTGGPGRDGTVVCHKCQVRVQTSARLVFELAVP